MPMRLFIIIMLLTILSTITAICYVNKSILNLVLNKYTQWIFCFVSISLFLAVFVVWMFTPSQGLFLQWQVDDEELMSEFILPQSVFDINPSQLPDTLHNTTQDSLTITGLFQNNEPIHALLIYCSHGSAEWKLDGKPFSSILQESNNRSHFTYSDIPPGIHKLECVLSDFSVIPRISVRSSIGSDETMKLLPGPFIHNLDRGGFQNLVLKKRIMYFMTALGLFFLIPVFNSWFIPLITLSANFSGFILNGLWFIVLFAIIQLQWLFLHDPSYLQIESDESAFGLMSQLLQLGQSPPLFHYGQNYQGTIESVLLTFLQNSSLSYTQALKALPMLWFMLFLSITTATFWRFGSKALALFSCVVFLFMGIHFHWIFHKAWFGYSFSLVCGSFMWYSALSIARYGMKPSYTFLWGIFAGLAMYELPIALPFVISSFALIQYKFFHELDYSELAITSRLKSILFHKNMLVLYCSFFLYLSPYLLSIPLENKSESISFLLKGRSLAAPNNIEEHPFFDRFLEECLPVLCGVRQPYDHQFNPSEITFPFFPTVLLCIGLFTFFLLRRKIHSYLFLFHNLPVSIFIVSFVILTILIGCTSPFGIWPWYFIAVYWAVPLLLYPLFAAGIRFSPGLTFIATLMFIITQLQSFSILDEKAFQPLSITSSGLDLPSDVSSIRNSLRENRVEYLIADQGFDYSAGNAGRDWIGETFSYQSGLQVISFDTHSRRLPDQAQMLARANNVGYLFHNDFLYHNPTSGDQNYSTITIDKLCRLFGPNFLDYQKISKPPYLLFIPQKKENTFHKNSIRFESKWNYFLEPILDHNMGFRSTSSRAYWSSDMIPADGINIRFTFPQAKPVDRIVFYHGSKAKDYPWKSEVWGITPNGNEMFLGEMTYDPNALASKFDYQFDGELQSIEVIVFPNKNGYWLTIYEAWIF